MTVAVGVALGGVLFTVFSSVYFATLDRKTWNDGQFIVLFAALIPIGCIIGGVTTLVGGQVRRKQFRDAGFVAMSGAVAIAVLGIGVDVVPAIVYAIGLMVWGIRLAFRSPGSEV